MKVLKERQLETFIEKLKRRSSVSGGMDDIQETVRKIINDVRKRGDRAVRKYTEKFDSITLKRLAVSKREIESSAKKAGKEFQNVIRRTARRIKTRWEVNI